MVSIIQVNNKVSIDMLLTALTKIWMCSLHCPAFLPYGSGPVMLAVSTVWWILLFRHSGKLCVSRVSSFRSSRLPLNFAGAETGCGKNWFGLVDRYCFTHLTF